MDLVQQGNPGWTTNGSRSIVEPRLLRTGVLSIGLAAAFLAGTVYAGAGARPASIATVDPLTQPAAVEFRQSEHAANAAIADPLTQPAAIEFREGERAASRVAPSAGDPFTQPAAIEFRQSEHDAGR